MKKEDVSHLFNNPDVIFSVISAINEEFKQICKRKNENIDLISYFFTEHCNVYIEILHTIFEEHMKIYINDDLPHVIAKIGDYFYDVRGLLVPQYEDLDHYEEISLDHFFYLSGLSVGNTTPFDKKIIPHLSEIGKNQLNDIITKIKQKTKT